MSDSPSRPLVSVVMATHNAMPYLPLAVDSVLQQSYDHFEFIIVDDASSDDSAAYLSGIRDARVRVVTNEANLGPAASVNRGLGEARGDLIARMDADDICDPARLRVQVDFLNAHPEVGVVGSHFTLMSADGRDLRKVIVARRDDVLRFRLLYTFPMCNPTMMIRRQILTEHSLAYDPSLRMNEDYAFLIALSQHAQMANVPDYLLQFRKHGASLTSRNADRNFEMQVAIVSTHQRAVLGAAIAEDAAVQTFTRRYVTRDWPTQTADVLAFARGLRRLADAYLAAVPEASPRAVLADSAEMLWRGLAIRGKLYKHPLTMARLMASPAGLTGYLPYRGVQMIQQMLKM